VHVIGLGLSVLKVTRAVLSQGEPRDAAVNYDTYIYRIYNGVVRWIRSPMLGGQSQYTNTLRLMLFSREVIFEVFQPT